MRFQHSTTLLLVAVKSVIAVPSQVEPPRCGLLCISQSTFASTCDLMDLTCICSNEQLQAEIQTCVASNCTIREQLATKKYSYDACDVVGEDRRALVWIIGVVFGVLGLVAFLLRCFARLYIGRQAWGMDDWFMCLAVGFMMPVSFMSVPIAQHGLGLDMWNVPFDDITSILYLYFWDEILYAIVLSLTKISILFFYIKIFPKRSFRYMVYGLMGLNLCYAIAFVFALVFQCTPIQGAWRAWDGTFEARCHSINVIGWSAAAINIVLDLITICLPLPELFRLSMSPKKKIQIMSMFTVGFFVTIVSGLRLRSLIAFGKTENLTQDYVEAGYWTTIEVPVGIICACMPAIRSLFSLVFPRAFGTTRGNNYASGYASQKARSRVSTRPMTGNAIRVNKEWTVMSGPADLNGSDVELFSFEQMATVEAPPKKTTPNRHSDMLRINEQQVEGR
ncbi:uncharacterized protein BCR38DRAFT_430610 [Pseudomassariella vexata]|uniref:CFEM domain-containing protein n=1 Tax=Pseudomassariella vexata TaxID=1141098 RepID=A0A1Y2E4Q3_9PEZI|nr:uncharacterized protein BCR38DRAFT_430610 [Pseudomassariella vexata]ORY66543.1 hypothetical protein BCR38DRAFT_430610 [Pseudomassariella vexata]